MDNKKTLTKEAVKLALDLLILTNGQATTLEIKLHLQNLEYFAKQENVHDLMEEIFAENIGKYQRSLNNGSGPAYNIYTAVTDWEATVAASQNQVTESKSDKLDFVSKTGEVNKAEGEVNHFNPNFTKSLDEVIAEQNTKTPMHAFHDRIRDSKMVPGVAIIAEYTPATKTLKTINDLNGGDPEPEKEEVPYTKIPKSAIAKQIIDMIVDKLGVLEEEVIPTASFTNDLGCDSLDAVELVMEMERLFNISIPDEDAEKMITVGNCITYIETAIGKTAIGVPSSDNRAPLFIFYTPQQFEKHKSDALFNPKNWVCHQRFNDETEIHVYSHSVTRDQARSRFASLNRIKSGEVRCSTAGNFEASFNNA